MLQRNKRLGRLKRQAMVADHASRDAETETEAEKYQKVRNVLQNEIKKLLQNRGILKGASLTSKEVECRHHKRQKRRAYFNQLVLLRMPSDEEGQYDVVPKELKPGGEIRNDEQRKASKKQRDIDYVFLHTIFVICNHTQEVDVFVEYNIQLHTRTRCQLELDRHKRTAYKPTLRDIYDKCVWVLAVLDREPRIDITGGNDTITIGQGGINIKWIIQLRDYIEQDLML